jgi:secreted PhoX family phosphatase
MRSTFTALICAAGAAAAFAVAAHAGFGDFGLFRDQQLDAHSEQLFGIVSPVEASSTESIGATDANADPTKLVTLAKGLQAHVVTAVPNAGANIDQMVLWPNDQNPTHLIVANEEGTARPGLQRIRLSDGLVETILTGTTSGDPVRRTPWGTILFGEENGTDGWLLEILDPLHTTNVVFNRVAGTSSDPTHVAARPALGRMSFEGIALYPSGVMYYGDENRPLNGTPGGAYFKFIPSTPWAGGTIGSLGQSPFNAGTIYGMRLGKRSGNTDYGQASETGLGTWVPVTNVPNTNLRAAAATLKLTGYYRPEDFEIDPVALAESNVRFCANNTGNESEDRNWGQTICITDGTLAQSLTNAAVPEVQFFVIGSNDFAMMDNIAYQFGHGNWIIHEDGDGPLVGRNNDLWSCLEDGDDADSLSDGCARVGTLNDLTAEWTGGVFDHYGTHFYVSVQHNITGHGVVLDITGWR